MRLHPKIYGLARCADALDRAGRHREADTLDRRLYVLRTAMPYHATSEDGVESIQKNGFDTGYIQSEYFREHSYAFFEHLSPEAKERVGERDDNQDNDYTEDLSPWEERVMEEWDSEHPNAQIIWGADRPFKQYGDHVLRFDSKGMTPLLNDYDGGTGYLHEDESGKIPPSLFSQVSPGELDTHGDDYEHWWNTDPANEKR